MKKKTTGVTLWYFSMFFLIIALCFVLFCFFNNWEEKYSIPFAVSTLVSGVLYAACYKNIKWNKNYTLIQAISYYRICKAKGYTESYKNSDQKILVATSEELEVMQNEELTEKLKFYNEGKSIVESMNNPIIKWLWKYKDRLYLATKKGK